MRAIHKTENGYTLLFSVLISSLLLAIGLAILNISTKEVALSSAARESEFAFYAADSGAECAMRWDFQGALATTTANATVTCNGTTEGAVYSNAGGVWTVTLDDNSQSGKNPCFSVTVEKKYVSSNLKTKIESRGYNTCDVNNPRRVERAIKIEY